MTYSLHAKQHSGASFVHLLAHASQMFGKRMPFAFLEDIKTRFFSSYAHSCKEVNGSLEMLAAAEHTLLLPACLSAGGTAACIV